MNGATSVVIGPDYPMTLILQERGTGRELARREVTAEEVATPHLVDQACLVWRIMYNRLSVSGGVSWWDPATGKSINGISARVELKHPDTGEIVQVDY